MVRKGSRRWRRQAKRGPSKRPPPPPNPPEEDKKPAFQRFQRYAPILRRWLPLTALLILALLVRLAPTEAARLGLFQGDDEYWHLHIVNQMLTVGYRSAIDVQAWAPMGRPVVHPPVYHYLIYGLARLLSNDAYRVMFIIGPIIGVVACLGWYLLARKLWGRFSGLVAAGVYAVLPLEVASTCLGCSRPQMLAEAIMPYALYLSLCAREGGRRAMASAVSSGLLLAAMALTWEASVYLYIPLVILYWLARTLAHRADRPLHTHMATVLAIASAAATAYYAPIYATYGIWRNTPAWMLRSTLTFWRPDIGFLLYAHLAGCHILYLAALLIWPVLIRRIVLDRGELPREAWGLTLFGVGLAGEFVGPGMRLMGAALGSGIILLLASGLGRLHAGRPKMRRGLALALGLLFGLSGLYTFHFAGSTFTAYYEETGLTELREALGDRLPTGSTVICRPQDAAFLLGLGMRTPWDLYLEHLPPWAPLQASRAAGVYLARSEEEALRLMRELNASHILVRLEQTQPDQLAMLLEAAGRDGGAEDYFNLTEVRESRPKVIRDPVTGGPLIVPGVFEEAVVGYEWAPTERGRELLLARLLWNNATGNVLRNPMPDPPQRFRLVWVSRDRRVALYGVAVDGEG